jgi:CubicO group peptidase (beta-lactamase class C family)
VLHYNVMRLFPVLAAALLLGGCGGHRGTPAVSPTTTTQTTADPATVNPAVVASSEGLLDAAIKPGAPGCSAAVGVNGKPVWIGVRGVANLATEEPITPDTVFDIASVSKQFTAAAILLLVEAGKLTLNDPLSQHMPGLPAWAAAVTVAQLMHHTSGIPDYTGLLQAQGYGLRDRTTQEQALQALAGVSALDFAPGTSFEYSDSNYLLLGEIVQRVAGEPLPQHLNATIFGPLGLAMVVDPVGHVAHKAVSYEKADGHYQVADSLWEQIGDGSVQTTPSQLVRWADNYRTGTVGGKRLLDDQLAGAVETEPGGANRYGAGIYLMSNGTLDHDGAWAGFVTAFRVSADRSKSLAVSCNTDKQDAEALADSLAKLWM